MLATYGEFSNSVLISSSLTMNKELKSDKLLQVTEGLDGIVLIHLTDIEADFDE